LFYGVFVRFLTRGVQKHHKNFLGEVHAKNFLPKKLREQKGTIVFSFYRVFLAVSLNDLCMRGPKTPQK
jgi:hypothetical protein